MMRFFSTLLVIVLMNSFSWAQTPTVPERIKFADIELKLTNYARNEIQMDVNSLHKNEKYFNMKLVRVNQYFPIVERILKEENVPDDIKYLIIQESALISDAVSSANAVGFWQFKKVSGLEVGLRIDNQIDERMNIVSSTHGAAKYLKKNNFYLKNWMYAVSAYQAGLGGVEKYVSEKYKGAKRMEINKQTHWYFKKFLAHKIAFQNFIGENIDESNSLFEYTDGRGKSMNQISKELDVSDELLYQYNKWLKSGRIPDDKKYTVIIPGYKEEVADDVIVKDETNTDDYNFQDATIYPMIKTFKNETRNLKINGIPGIIASEGDDIYDLIRIGKINLSKFLKFNDIDISHNITSGQVYYLKKKKGKAREYYHITYPGESLWSISQKYGMRLKSLMTKNRIEDTETLKVGRILWLRFIRPDNEPVEFKELKLEDLEDPVAEEKPNAKTDDSSSEKQLNENIEDDSLFNQTEVVTLSDNVSESVEETNNGSVNEISDKGIPEEYLAEIAEEEYNTKPAFHLVNAGETLYALSKRYDITIEDLLKWNDLELSDGIKVGQKIYLSQPYFQVDINTNNENIEKPYIEHLVLKGETLYSISKKYGVSVQKIVEWNGKIDNNIKEGDSLKIYK